MEPSYYAVIPGEVRMAKIPDGAKILFGDITSLARRDGFCFATNRYLSEISGKSERTIQNWIGQMEILGFLEIEIEENNARKIYIGNKKNESVRVKKIAGGYEKNCRAGTKKISPPYIMYDNNNYNNNYSFFKNDEKKEKKNFENNDQENQIIFDIEILKKFINFGVLSEKYPWKNLENCLIDFFLFYQEKSKIIKKSTAQMQFDRWLKGPAGRFEQEKEAYEEKKKRICQVDKIKESEEKREQKERKEVEMIRDFLNKNPEKVKEWREFHEADVLALSKGSKQVAEALMRGKINREARIFLEKTGQIEKIQIA